MDDLRSEWQSTRRLHILVYRFLLNFYTKNNLLENLPTSVQSFITILKSVEEYNEFLVLKSMYNIGILIELFDKCVSEDEFKFFKELKIKLLDQMKKLKELNQVEPLKKIDNDDTESIKSMIDSIKNMYEKNKFHDENQPEVQRRTDIKKRKRRRAQGIVRTVKPKKKVKINEISEPSSETTTSVQEPSETISLPEPSETISLPEPSETIKESSIIDSSVNKTSVIDSSIFILSSDEETQEISEIKETPVIQNIDKLEGILDNLDLSIYEKTQDILCVQKMNRIYENIPKNLNTVNRISEKLNLTTSYLDHSLHEMSTIPVENVLKSYNDIKYDIYLDQKSIPNIMHTKSILYSVGPIQVRCHDGDYAYYCTIENCKAWFVSKPIYLQRHIQAIHNNIKCNWSCSQCSIIPNSSQNICDLEKAFAHLMNNHVNKKYELFEKYQDKNDIYVFEIEEDTGLRIDNVVSLNPSFKNKISCIPKLFLCPMKPCQYTTDDEVSAFRHLNIKFGQFECYKCTYCDRFFTNAFSFCGHIFKDHRKDKYQCTECVYRSISKNNVAQHQIDNHATTTVKVLLGNELKSEKEEITNITIIPYKCTKKNCTFSTHILSNFTQHLFKCDTKWLSCQNKICNFLTNNPDTLLEHLSNHGIGEFQCRYCPSAYFNKQAIRRHMYEIHPSKYPSVFQRVSFKTESDKFKQFTKVEPYKIDNDVIACIDLDSCTADELCNTKVVYVEEYQNILNSYECSTMDNEPDQTDIVIDNIVLSDSETEETNENDTVTENNIVSTKNNVLDLTEADTVITTKNNTVMKSMLSTPVNWSISTNVKKTPTRPVVNGNNVISPIVLKALPQITSPNSKDSKKNVAKKSTTKNC